MTNDQFKALRALIDGITPSPNQPEGTNISTSAWAGGNIRAGEGPKQSEIEASLCRLDRSISSVTDLFFQLSDRIMPVRVIQPSTEPTGGATPYGSPLGRSIGDKAAQIESLAESIRNALDSLAV